MALSWASTLTVYRMKNMSMECTEKLLSYVMVSAFLVMLDGCFQQWVAVLKDPWYKLCWLWGSSSSSLCLELRWYMAILMIAFCVGVHLLLLLCELECVPVTKGEKKRQFKTIETLVCTSLKLWVGLFCTVCSHSYMADMTTAIGLTRSVLSLVLVLWVLMSTLKLWSYTPSILESVCLQSLLWFVFLFAMWYNNKHLKPCVCIPYLPVGSDCI